MNAGDGDTYNNYYDFDFTRVGEIVRAGGKPY
jgi:hypothetical protein